MDYKSLAEQLVKKCVKKGADAAEVYIENGRELNIEVRNGDIETAQETSSHGAGFRVFVKGKMAFSHCNDFSEAALDNAVQSAITFAKTTTPDENNVLPDEKEITEIADLYDPKISQVSMEKKIEILIKDEEGKFKSQPFKPKKTKTNE